MASKNRFEQVDERQEDAITLSLSRKADAGVGWVHCPAALSGGRMAEDQTSGELPAKDAFRSAVKLANEMQAPLVVVDADNVWDGEWGVLYRPV